MRFLDRMCEAPLTNSPQLGRFTLADVLRSQSGAADAQGAAAPTQEQITGAFRDTNPEELRATHGLAVAMVQFVRDIDGFLTRTVGADQAPNLDLLTNQLKEIEKAIAPNLPDGAGANAGGEAGEAGAAVGGGAPAKAITGEIQSRMDVIKMIDKICQYYARTEPASPVPGVLKRAKRLAEMDFMQIIKDLCPDAESTVRSITGEREEDASA
jgi:type VI secretion system protein ImpA